MIASCFGHVEAMRVLIEKGANLEATSSVRIHSHATTHACSSGYAAQASLVKVVYSKLMRISIFTQ
jgi:hypothetical protein